MREYMKKCGRCGGSGLWFDRGLCFNCRGAGQVKVTVFTAEEKADRKAAFDRILNARVLVRDAAKGLPRQEEWYADQGFSELHTREPERFDKMLTSVEAGRAYDVAKALSEYCESGYPDWYGQK